MGKHWSEMATPRRQGRAAFRQGERADGNPYEAGTGPARQWATGFAVARALATPPTD